MAAHQDPQDRRARRDQLVPLDLAAHRAQRGLADLPVRLVPPVPPAQLDQWARQALLDQLALLVLQVLTGRQGYLDPRVVQDRRGNPVRRALRVLRAYRDPRARLGQPVNRARAVLRALRVSRDLLVRLAHRAR